MNYNEIERVRPRWREKWKRPLLRIGGSTGITIPKPILDCFGARPRKNVWIGWIYDADTDRDFLVIDFLITYFISSRLNLNNRLIICVVFE